MENMEQFWTEGYWVGLLVIVLYIIETVLLVKTKVFSPRYSRIEDAKSRGHMVNGTCIKGGYITIGDEGPRDRRPQGTYEYFVDGKRYEYRCVFTSMSSNTPPTSVTLYYLDNPKKVFTEDKYSPKRILFHLIAWGVPMLIYGMLYGGK